MKREKWMMKEWKSQEDISSETGEKMKKKLGRSEEKMIRINTETKGVGRK